MSNKRKIAFVAYLDQDNLGVGYIAARLLGRGFYIHLLDMRQPFSIILETLIKAQPLVIGFSVVFQYHLNEFRDLIACLRESGLDCHFCAGGHYPSFRYQQILDLVPGLDSVVLFEGEHTFTELAEMLRDGRDWHNIRGLAYRKNGNVHCTGLRPLEKDLDRFGPPVRKPNRAQILGHKVVNILSGRGCHYNCSFCSIRAFYSQPPGPIKRIRNPEFVAREMQLHYEQDGSSIFLFQDDDFPIAGQRGKTWIEDFCGYLRTAGLKDSLLWKISCRPNEVNEASLSLMMEYGLGMVYLGIESGTSQGLQLMNKQISAEVSLAAVNILKRIKLEYEFGFMVFDPSSTFDTVRENLRFLMTLCGDGSAAVSLGKTLPLAGTALEEQLRREGRLYGAPAYEDYDFLDPLLDEYFNTLSTLFRPWIHGENGVMTLSRWVHFQVIALERFCGEAAEIHQALLNNVSNANHYLIQTCESLADIFQSSSETQRQKVIDYLESEVMINHDYFANRLKSIADQANQIASAN